jgi:uncharacterized membrane protein
MTYLIWLLRIIHIGAGMIWVGGTLMMAFFIGPTIQATAEAGQKFAAHLIGAMKFSQRMSAAAGLTILAGFLLYGIDSQWFSSTAWMRSGAGTGFGIGALFGLIGFISGNVVGGTLRQLGRLGAQAQGQPSPEQVRQMQALQKRQATATQITAYSLILSVIFMAIARYFVF